MNSVINDIDIRIYYRYDRIFVFYSKFNHVSMIVHVVITWEFCNSLTNTTFSNLLVSVVNA